MSLELSGGHRRLSSSRALVCDILHYDRLTPSFVHSRSMHLDVLADARAAVGQSISWSVLFAKAYGLLSAECPLLRQAWLAWPWPRVYEHPHSIGTVALSRQHAGEERLFWLRLRRPESHTLVELQQSLDKHREAPVEELFGRQLQVSRWPTPLRRFGWWTTLNLSGERRARRLGTFGLTTLAGQGVEIDRPPSIHTSTLTYGPLDDNGRCRVAITYDHRLVDGLLIARCLVRLETLLNGQVTEELHRLHGESPRRLAS